MIPISPELRAGARALSSAALIGLVVSSLVSCGRPKPLEGETPPPKQVTATPEGGAMTPGTAAGVPGADNSAQPGAAGTSQPGTAMPAGTPPAAAGTAYATAEVLLQDLIAKLQAGDWNGFLDLAGAQAATAANRVRLRGLMAEHSYRVNDPNALTVTDRNENSKLVVLKLQPGKPEDAALGEQKIEMDLARDPGERWGVKELRVPDLVELIAAKMAKDSTAAAGDPLRVAGLFLDAVVKKDFGAARRIVDTAKLSDEKLAALFIVVEEGNFKPHQNKPLISTMARTNVAWVIARLQSAEQQSDFGIEMARAADAAPWLIVGLNFSKLIQKVASQAGAGDIAYSPLQNDLKGGEQIVIYFEFDGTGVNARAEKQLRIIGEILRADPARTLTINGHADALGMDDYNKQLSEKRASAIREFLSQSGIPPKQIITQGFGEAVPKAPNVNPDGTDNPSGRAQNRRAEVTLKF